MSDATSHEPTLLKAVALSERDVGSWEWDRNHNSDLVSVSNQGHTIEWGPKKPESAMRSKMRPGRSWRAARAE